MMVEKFLVVPFYNNAEYLAVAQESINFQDADEIKTVFVNELEQTDNLASISNITGPVAVKSIRWDGLSTDKKNRKSEVDSYVALKEFLQQKGCFTDFEKSFMNAALFDLISALKNAETDSLYRDILTDIKYCAEDDLHFLDKPATYYYDMDWVKEYVSLICKKPDYSDDQKNPKVTVVIPSLNSRPYIRECVESAMEQTLKQIEILCVDAGSTDGTIEVIQEYANLDKRIKIIHSDKRSYGYQINLGIKNASGEYLAILESDDYIVPGMYEELYDIAKENKIEMLKADFEVFTGEKGHYQFILRKIANKDNQYNKVLDPTDDLELFKNNNVPWTGLYEMEFMRRNSILLNESAGAAYQDNGLWFQCICQTHRLYYVNKSYYRLRRDNPNSSVYSRSKVFCACGEYDFIRNFLKKDSELEKKYAPFCAYYRYTHYNWTLNRIAEEFKLEFYEKFAEDFRKIKNDGELSPVLFTKGQLNIINEIIENPVEYYYKKSKLTYEFIRVLPPQRYPEILCKWYKGVTKHELDLNNPKTVNEKTQWLKLYENTPLKTRLSDKYLVREWVKEKIGETYLIPLLGVWDKFDDIDFDKLPDSFVLKANHGSGWNVIVKNKKELDIADAKAKFDIWLKTNFAIKTGLELQYADIPPKIIAEQYIENGDNDLYDYKVFCFNGRANSIMYLSERKKGLKMAFYDLKWNKLPFVYSYPRNEETIEKPKNLELLISLAEKLAAGFAFVRVDFYILNDGSLKFGEMTFTSMSGIARWNPLEQDLIFGNLIDLALVKKTPLPNKSFAEKGAIPLPDSFKLPKTEVEMLKDTIKAKDGRIRSLEKDKTKLQKDIKKIKDSKSFKLGEKIAYPIRKFRDLIKK